MMILRRLMVTVITLIILLLGEMSAYCQSCAVISGTVQNESGGLVAGALISTALFSTKADALAAFTLYPCWETVMDGNAESGVDIVVTISAKGYVHEIHTEKNLKNGSRRENINIRLKKESTYSEKKLIPYWDENDKTSYFAFYTDSSEQIDGVITYAGEDASGEYAAERAFVTLFQKSDNVDMTARVKVMHISELPLFFDMNPVSGRGWFYFESTLPVSLYAAPISESSFYMIDEISENEFNDDLYLTTASSANAMIWNGSVTKTELNRGTVSAYNNFDISVNAKSVVQVTSESGNIPLSAVMDPKSGKLPPFHAVNPATHYVPAAWYVTPVIDTVYQLCTPSTGWTNPGKLTVTFRNGDGSLRIPETDVAFPLNAGECLEIPMSAIVGQAVESFGWLDLSSDQNLIMNTTLRISDGGSGIQTVIPGATDTPSSTYVWPAYMASPYVLSMLILINPNDTPMIFDYEIGQFGHRFENGDYVSEYSDVITKSYEVNPKAVHLMSKEDLFDQRNGFFWIKAKGFADEERSVPLPFYASMIFWEARFGSITIMPGNSLD